MVLLAKRVRASTVASISTSVSSASLHLMMRPAMCSSSAAVKRAPLGWLEDCGAGEIRGRLVADFFLAFAILLVLVLAHSLREATSKPATTAARSHKTGPAATKANATASSTAKIRRDAGATSQRRLQL